MRLSISLFIFLSGFLFAGNLQAQKQAATATAEIHTKVYCSHCQACETCGIMFDAELYKLKGLKSFTVTPEKNIITVIYNPKKLNLDAIKKCIAACGYDADEVKATPEGLSRLDNCCRKPD